MNPHEVFCHNPDCPATGKVDRGNIGVHRGSLSIKRADSECDSKSYSLFIRLIASNGVTSAMSAKRHSLAPKAHRFSVFAIRLTRSRGYSLCYLTAVRFKQLSLPLT